MSEFLWFIPSGGDGRDLVNSGVRSVRGGASGARAPDIDYLALVAHVAEQSGFDGAMLPSGVASEDPWLVAAALAAETRHLGLLVSARPGHEGPVSLALKAATLQSVSDGRVRLLVVNGSHAEEQRGLGDFLGHDERYARSSEFLAVMRATWTGAPVRHAGEHYLVDSPGLPVARTTPPPVWIGGASDAALRVAAAQADVHALWGETPPMVAERIAALRTLAHAAGREVDSALRIHVIARATEAEAWAEAGRLLSAVPQSLVDVAQRQLARSESVGQQRMRGLHRGRTTSRVRDLEVYPNVWSGVGLVRGGAGTALVGSHAQVAERIHEYHAQGVNRFILSGYPNLEEAREVGEQVLPRVRGSMRRHVA